MLFLKFQDCLYNNMSAYKYFSHLCTFLKSSKKIIFMLRDRNNDLFSWKVSMICSWKVNSSSTWRETFPGLRFSDKSCLETVIFDIAKWNRDESGWRSTRMINDSVYVGHRIAMEMLVYLIHHRDRDTDRPHPSWSACRSVQISLVKSALRTYD